MVVKHPTYRSASPGHTVSVTDGNNACSVQQIFNIQPGGSPQVSDIELTPVRCSGENNGQISVVVSDGLAPYQFDWSTGPGQNSLSGLTAGNYALTTTDANGCSATAQFTVSEPTPLLLLSTVDSTSCTSNTGNIAAVAQGGTAPYTFIWNSGQNTAGLTGIAPGTYILTVTDAEGCSNSQSFTIEPGGAPVLTNTVLIPVRCAGEMNGAISTDVVGGVAPYLLLWSTGASGAVLNNLPAGDYLLTATDANGCSTVQQFSLTEPMALTYLATVDSTSCTSSTGDISRTARR